MLSITVAANETHYLMVRELMAEYIAWDCEQSKLLGLDTQEFTDFYYGADPEVLPGGFAPPAGYLLLAMYSGKAAGCGAFQRIDLVTCEMKRMYVRPEFRGMSIGRKMAEILIPTARNAGYTTMLLETTSFMKGAHTLYATLGFLPCEPYYDIPPNFRPITSFMKLDL